MTPQQPFEQAGTPLFRMLPEIVFDFLRPEGTPGIVLTLSLREGEKPTPEQLSLAIGKLHWSINELDLATGGTGLYLEVDPYDPRASDVKIGLSFKPAEPSGADERLRHLADRINQDSALIPAPFERCEARIAA